MLFLNFCHFPKLDIFVAQHNLFQMRLGDPQYILNNNLIASQHQQQFTLRVIYTISITSHTHHIKENQIVPNDNLRK